MKPDDSPDGTATEASVEETTASSQVVPFLDQFKVISNEKMQWLVVNLPYFLIFFLLIDWLLGWNTFVGDPLRFPAIVVMIIDLFIMWVLFARVPETFRSIYAQGLIRASTDGLPVEESLVQFLRQFEGTLNSRWSWLVGVFLAVGSFFMTLGGLALLGVYQGPSKAIQLIVYFFFARLGFIGPLLGFLIGLLIWRVAIIALYIHRFGKKYELNLIISHPDKSGGLKPLGDICLMIAFLLLVPAIYLSFWGIVVTNYQIEGTEFYARVWSDVFRKLLIVLSGTAFFLFVQPLYSVHIQMEKREKELRAELEMISQKIGQLTNEIWTHAETGEPAQGIEKMKSLEFMTDVYQKNRRIPTWPLDWGTIWKFVGGQAVPLLTFIGTSDPLIKSIQALLSSFSQ